MTKTGLSEVMVQRVISLYDDAKTRVRIGFAYLEEFEEKFRIPLNMHKWRDGVQVIAKGMG